MKNIVLILCFSTLTTSQKQVLPPVAPSKPQMGLNVQQTLGANQQSQNLIQPGPNPPQKGPNVPQQPPPPPQLPQGGPVQVGPPNQGRPNAVAPAPPPVPPVPGAAAGGVGFAFPVNYGCDDNSDTPSQKYYNEKCSNDNECYGSNDKSMVCQKGVCTCGENFMPQDTFLGEASTQKICVSPPYLFAPCETVCQKPAVCKPYEGSPTKVCQCNSNYKYVDGICILDCKDGEYYNAEVAKCLPKCKANEVKINATCKQLVGVGGACDDNIQCQPAYSECKDKKCACRTGFTAKGDLCVTQVATCPTGDPLKSGDGYKICTFSEIKIDPKSKKPPPVQNVVPLAAGAQNSLSPMYPPGPFNNNELKDDCPQDTHFCMTTGGEFPVSSGTGICCPKLKSECPFGKAHPTASCQPATAGADYCPWETHYCYSVSAGSTTKQSCCPKQCGSQFVQVNGKCYPTVALNEACTFKQQCVAGSADCVNGVCKCAEGAKEEGGQLFKYCNRQCKSSEIMFGNDCYESLKLGDSCEGQTWRCPTNAYCNNKQKCSCLCGMFTLAKDVCAPQPVCPSMQPFFPLAFGAAGNVAAPPPPPPPPGTISESKKKELLKNVTFCKIKGKNPPSLDNPPVDACQKNEYCASYIENLGICCTTPPAKCMDGSKPLSDKPCDTSNPISCGPSNTCFQYLQLADPDSNPNARICCRNLFAPVPAK